jgi:hypothetical protein
MLEGVRELEEEHCGFPEVLDLGGLGRRVATPGGGDLICEVVCEEFLYKDGRLRGIEMDEEGGA